MSIIKSHYKNYCGEIGFDTFHTEIINMPRDHFSDTSIEKIQLLASYLLLTENELPKDGCDYKKILQCIAEKISKGKYPKQRCIEWETTYFSFTDINFHYNNCGRMFRHLMGICSLFGMIKSFSKNKKYIIYDRCKEYVLSSADVLMPVVRNNMILLSAETNDYIKSIHGINITDETKYRPTYAILKYMQMMDRPVTPFEISILFGRIDNLKTENEILKRAVAIGSILPATQQEQITFFFKEMGWYNKNGFLFIYRDSQAPYFKFQNFLLYLQAFDLIEINSITNLISLTKYAIELLSQGSLYLLADLETLLKKLDNNKSNRELNDLILHNRNPELLELAKSDDKFIQKINEKSLKNPIISNGKRQRNDIVAELSKILVDYKCQYTGKHTFKTPCGKYYCNPHHIIQFSQNGPDITENIVVLGAEAHAIAHHGCKEEVRNLYVQLVKNGAIKYEQFEKMATIYHCLTKEHIEILFDNFVITQLEKEKLLKLISK